MRQQQIPLSEFQAWPKIPRHSPLSCMITEKIDGSNACVVVRPADPLYNTALPHEFAYVGTEAGCMFVSAQSRTRFITPENDNYGFAGWVKAHAEELVKLGRGRHFGEWYGVGIQRGYGLYERRFALFADRNERPACCGYAPVLYYGQYTASAVAEVQAKLESEGSRIVPGFMKPEGIVIKFTHVAPYMKITDLAPGSK